MDASNDVIQFLVSHRASWDTNGNVAGGSSTLYWPNGFFDAGTPGWSSQTQLPRFWVLDRANPIARPTSFVAPDVNTVPAGISALMDVGHLLVAGIFADAYRLPQGPLYDFLVANGAGAALSMVEALNTGLACGLRCFFAYTLVSVAGGNEGPGIEILTLPVPLHCELRGSYAESLAVAPFELIREDDGAYYPVKNPV